MAKRDPSEDPRLPALSFHQPWGGLIARGFKPYENRSKRPGDWLLGREVALHSAQSFDPKGLALAEALEIKIARKDPKAAAGLIGIARLKGWIEIGDCASGLVFDGGEIRHATDEEIDEAEGSPWTMRGKVWWWFTEARICPPISARGWPGLFRLEPDQELQLRERLRATAPRAEG